MSKQIFGPFVFYNDSKRLSRQKICERHITSEAISVLKHTKEVPNFQFPIFQTATYSIYSNFEGTFSLFHTRRHYTGYLVRILSNFWWFVNLNLYGFCRAQPSTSFLHTHILDYNIYNLKPFSWKFLCYSPGYKSP